MSGRSRAEILDALKARVARDFYQAWCDGLQFIDDGDAVRVPVPNRRYQDLLQRELGPALGEAFALVFARSPEIRFTIDPTLPPAPEPPPAAPVAAAPAPAASPPSRGAPHDPLRPRLNDLYTFERFVAGSSNRLAHAAAVAVAERPAGVYNPFFIHGGVGLGKTHLLQAVCHAVLRRNPYARVAYLPCETFVNEFISAVRRNDLEAFRRRHRSTELLVLDDVHFLANKEGSQEEFFHTYNALHLNGRQVILSSDAPPKDIPALQERIVSRMTSGMVATIDAPTFEERVAIANKKALDRGLALPEEVARAIAEIVQSNVRELEGAVIRVVGFAGVARRALTPELAHEVLQDFLEEHATSAHIPDIQRVVAEYYRLKPSDLAARHATRAVSQARQVAIYLCRRLTAHSLKEIGMHFGDRDHTTMLYAIRKIEEDVLKDPRVRGDMEHLMRDLQSRGG